MYSKEYYHYSDLIAASFQANQDKQLSLEELRAWFDNSPLLGTTFDPRATYSPLENAPVKGEWVEPLEDTAKHTLLYLHGGAFAVGSPKSHRNFVSYLAAQLNVRILSLEYSLAPEHPFPAALEDCVDAYQWLLHLGTDPKHIIFAGDSAGGNLVLTTTLKLHDLGLPLPAALVALSPGVTAKLAKDIPTGLVKQDFILDPISIPALVELCVGKNDWRNPLLSPIFGDLKILPPTLIQVGTREIILPSILEFTEKAAAQGAPVTLQVWAGMWHVWQALGSQMPESERAIEEIRIYLAYHVEQ